MSVSAESGDVTRLIAVQRHVGTVLADIREQQKQLATGLGLLQSAPLGQQLSAARDAASELRALDETLLDLMCELAIAEIDTRRHQPA